MFSNLFSASASVWTALFAAMIAIPILVHLINLTRRKTIQWAAMDFLLKSHKKNRSWVWLKQLFLLLARIAALLLALIMLAQVGCHEDRISRLLGGTQTHHYVLLDDSFSMQDRRNGESAFERAVATISQIAARTRNRQNQTFTLVRYSSVRPHDANSNQTLETATSGSTSLFMDLDQEFVDSQFDQRIEEIKRSLTVSSLSVGIDPVLKRIAGLIKTRTDQQAIVYVLSDFREHDWKTVSQTNLALKEIHATGAAIELINCVSEQNENLAITGLEPVGNVRVAGAPLMMQLTVKNTSSNTAKNVQVKLDTAMFNDGRTDSIPQIDNIDVAEIPTVFIPEIAGGSSETATFPVFFNKPGKHLISARLDDDAVETDNRRQVATEFSTDTRVLLVDGANQTHSGFLSLAINPGAMTGVRPEFQTKDFLRDASMDELAKYDVIFMLDVDLLDQSAVENLEAFARNGGGVSFFLGPQTNLRFFNQSLYRNGDGVFPIELDKVVPIPEQNENKIPDIAPQSHPIFAPVLDTKTSLLDFVQVKNIIQPTIQWLADPPADSAIVASVRGSQQWPLVVERPFGKGQVMVVTTTAGPIWNNWCRNATFPPIMLLLEDYLAAGNYVDDPKTVGTPFAVDVPAESFLTSATVFSPTPDDDIRDSQETRLLPTDQQNQNRLGIAFATVKSTEIGRDGDIPGVYDIWMRRQNGEATLNRFALNPDTRESELAIANKQQLIASLSDSSATLVDWDRFNPEPTQQAGSSLSRVLLVALLLILIAEQWLAHVNSYHRG